MNKEAKEWKWEAIGGWISDTAKQYIRSIPVCANGEKDGYVWPMEKDGKYSAKSGYHVLKPVQVRRDIPVPSSHRIGGGIWKEIWKMRILYKIEFPLEVMY